MERDLIYKIGLSMIPNIGPVLARNLVAYCGSAEEVFKANKKELAKIPGIGESKANFVANADVFKRAEEEIKYIEKNGITPLYFLDADYPSRFKHFDYCPIILYYKGDKFKLNSLKTVAIIGTRKPSERGKIFTEKIVHDLADQQVTIVSGLAYGIDIIAHKSSLKNDLPTIGIMGNGHDIMYPSEHRDTAKKMEEKGGVLTEFCSGTKPDKVNFPMRNRLIAALADAIIVVESNASGGSMITAEYGVEYNKDVFAVPGRIDDEKSRGCNALIKKNKAHLIEDVNDLMYIMRWEESKAKKHGLQASLFIELNENEQRIVDFIRNKKEVAIDELIYGLQSPTSILASQLLNLEFKGVIKSLPGKKYMLC